MHERLLKIILALLCLLALCLPARAEGLWEVYQLAKQNDPQLGAAEAALLAARQARPKALAALLPSLLAAGSSGLNHYEDKNPVVDQKTGYSRANQDFDSMRYGLYLTQPVINLQSWVGVPQAGQRIEEAEATYRASLDEFCLRFLERYLRVLANEDRLRWAQAEKQAIGESLARAQKANRLGLISPTAEQRAQAAFDLAEADEIAAENRLENSREELREMTGVPVGELTPFRAALPLEELQPNDLAHWQRLALSQNHALLAKSHSQEGASLEIRRQQAAHAPTLNLTASHYYQDTGGRVPGEDLNSVVALEVRLPIFDGGMILAQTREARHLHHKVHQEYEGLRRLTLKKTAEAFRGLHESARRVKALEQAQKSNLAALKATQREVELGAGTMVDFLEVLRDYYRSRRDLSEAVSEHVLNQARLLSMTGQLNDEFVFKLNRKYQEGPLPIPVASPPPAPQEPGQL